MFKHVDEVVENDQVIRNGFVRKVLSVEVLKNGDDSCRGYMMMFEVLDGQHTIETLKPKQSVEVVEEPSEQSEHFKAGLVEGWRRRIEDLEEDGFEPGRWWRAIKGGVMMAETSDPSDFKHLGLMDDPEVTFRRMYVRTDCAWVMVETPDV